MVKNKHILVGVTGGIAAYKIPFLIRELKKLGAELRVVVTEAATEFVTPLTLSTLAGTEVMRGMFPEHGAGQSHRGTWHIDTARWADVMVIAPATANQISRLAHGAADDAVSTLALAVRCPVLVCPAMDEDMWEHELTQANVRRLADIGYRVLPPEEGELASGLVGKGRLPEVDAILTAIHACVDTAKEDLAGRKFLVTAGPTYEPIDPVRYVGNYSSGKMGFAIASAAALRGADVTLIAGSTSLPTPRHVKRVDVHTSDEMHEAVMRHRPKKDVIVMAAAVADFKPAHPSAKKLKKDRLPEGAMALEMVPTKDILAQLGKRKGSELLVGFALETDREEANARKKLHDKNLDYIVLNNPLRAGAGFGTDTNIVTIYPKRGKAEKLPKMSKLDVAHRLLDRISKSLG